MANEEKNTGNELYSYLACLAFTAFFSRVGELYPIFASIHINLLSFGSALMLFFFAGEYKTINWNQNNAAKLMIRYYLIGFVTIPFAVWPSGALARWKELFMINTLIYFFCLTSVQNEKQLVRLVYAFCLGTFLLVTALHINPIVDAATGRSYVTNSYDPNDLAMILAVTFPVVVGQFIVANKKWRLFIGAYLLMLISGILATGSRGGLMALAVAILMILFSSVVKVKILYKVLIFIIMILFLISPAADRVLKRWGSVVSGDDYNMTETEAGGGGRLAIWNGGLTIFSENFFLGVGVGNSSTAMGMRFGSTGWMTMHNTYMQAALEMGIGGIIVFILMLRSIWYNCKQIIKMNAEQSVNKSFFLLAYSIRIALVTFMFATFFISQAYTMIIPFFLITTDRVKFLAGRD